MTKKPSEIKFDLNDILIVPSKKTFINSRYKDINLPSILPLFTAPMDSVVNLTNIDIFLDNGVNVVLPRTVKYKDFKLKYNTNISKYKNVFVSFGFEDLDNLLKKNIIRDKDLGLHEDAHILLDVANGHLQKIVDYCKEIKRLRSDIIIMVGNIANPEAYRWYAKENCVNYIRCSIGSGNACSTSKNASVGYPLGSLVYEINEIKQELIKSDYTNLPYIIADGGMKDYSDIIKSLGLGSDFVMIGSIFNKALESCADNYLYRIKISNNKLTKFLFEKGFPIKKHFRGMSTKSVQKILGKTNIKTSEGVHRYRKVEYFLGGWIENFNHYLRSAMSYSNCKTLNDFIGKIKFVFISEQSYKRFDK